MARNPGFTELVSSDIEADATGFLDLDASGASAPPRASRRRRLFFALGAALGTAAFAAVVRRSSTEAFASANDGAALSLAAAEEHSCSGKGANCLHSKCCLDGGERGLQCFKKNDFWASCAESCAKGVHEGETHGTYDINGKFHLDEWSCAQLGNRSKPSCTTFNSTERCPSDRCMWKDSCLPACDIFPDIDTCSSAEKCMWKDKCMEACDTFDTEATCKPTDKCVWKNKKCQEGCWTFDQNQCSKHDRCLMVGSECKDNCWTFFSEDACGKHDRCMWNQDKCAPACSTYVTKQSCPGDIGCIWDVKEGDNGKATCMPDPCASPGEDCTQSKCCSSQRGAAGYTCYAKNKYYATCMPECDTTAKGKDDWSCRPLGNKSLFEPGCAWAGASCSKEGLCCNVGFNCLVKDDVFTGCVQVAKKSTWITMKVPIPSDWKGTFVGAGRTEYQVAAAAPGQPVLGTSLYCFMAILPGSAEVSLMKLAKKNNASIFACDASDVFHSWQSAKSGWDTGEATLTNTDVFINVWDQVRKAGRFIYHDWTVKVDADAVLVPWRLQKHIEALRPPPGLPIYLKNNNMDPGLGNSGFLGAVEVFSKVAMQIYFDNAEGCRKTLGIQAGEDGYFKGCMDALGVGYMTDGGMFKPDISPGQCVSQDHAAFHPLKQPVDWQCCVDILNGKPHNVVYGHCDLGYELHIE